LKQGSILHLYKEKANKYLNQRPGSNNINWEWNYFKGAVIQATNKVLRRCKKKCGNRGLQSWNQNTAHLIAEKIKHTCNLYRQNPKLTRWNTRGQKQWWKDKPDE
jgi:hypothetical protein